MFVKVFQLFQTCLIVCSAITCRFNNPVGWEAAVSVPVGKVVLALNHQEWRNTPALAINTGNRYSLFSIPWLNYLASATSIYTSNNYCRADYAHHKPSLIEVVEVVVQNTIFRLYIFH
jgi:hypothetical protein